MSRYCLLSCFLFVFLPLQTENLNAQEAKDALPVIKESVSTLRAADEIDRNAPPPNKYDMHDRRNYKFGYRYNYRPPAQWTPNPPSAGPHHYSHYRRPWRYRGSFGPYLVPSPTPGYPPILVTPERGAVVMPPIY